MNAISFFTPKAASNSGSGSGSDATTTSPTAPVTENMFLQLLVAQLKNQNPSNPSDSTQFVSQLAQFQTMQQSLNQGEDITAMRNDLDQMAASLTTAGK